MMVNKSRVTVLVKAYPQPSKAHRETVCCAGLDETGNWKRLYPVRFRHLTGEQAFKRWDVVSYDWTTPKSDARHESTRVHEESIEIVGRVSSDSEKSNIVERTAVPSEVFMRDGGNSLGLIRPRNVRLTAKRRSSSEIAAIAKRYEDAARQSSMLDRTLSRLAPCPFTFFFRYDDEAGPHTKSCGDWETYAAYFNLRKAYDEQTVIDHLRNTYCKEYVEKGLVFALGNMAKRPKTYQLLGVFPAERSSQISLL